MVVAMTYTAGLRFTPKQVAERYGVRAETVRQWIRDGRLEALDIGSPGRKVYRITENQLKKFERDAGVKKTA